MTSQESYPIKNFMTTDPITIDANASIEEAIQIMETSGVRHLPVLKDKYLVGVISDRDLAKVIQDCSSEKILEVNEVMSPSPYTVSPEEEMKNVLQVMASNRLGSVIIKTHGDRVAGIFTSTDAVSLLAKLFT